MQKKIVVSCHLYIIHKVAFFVKHDVSFGEYCPVFMVENRTEIHKNRHCVMQQHRSNGLSWPLLHSSLAKKASTKLS